MNSDRGKTITGIYGSFRRSYVWLSIVFLATATLITCEKPERQVLISVMEAIDADISYTSVTLRGNIEDLGSAPIDDYGLLVSLNGLPEPANSIVKSLGKPSAKGEFEAKIENLTSNTTYSFRAYVTAEGTNIYSQQTKQFTTKAYSLPSITTTDPSSITSSSASSGGNITADGGASVTARGVCWSTAANPTTDNTKTTDGTGTGSYVSNISGLIGSTTYHIRAYATNTAGTAYGEDKTFRTAAAVVLPTVSTLSVTSIGTTSATGGGDVTNAGNGTVTARGLCWSESANPVVADFNTVEGSGTGMFLSNMSNLSPSTTYHVRAYATNSAGTAYGDDVTFTTNSSVVVPTVTTSSVLSITSSSAISGGSITSAGGGTITSKGVCWSTTINPTVNDDKNIEGTGTASFSSSLTGLNAGTTYHVRAYATNSAGTGYGADLTFTTLITTYAPTVVTGSVSSIGTTTATCGGTVNDDGGDPVTEKGVCYGLNANPTILDSKTSDGTGTGSFVSNLTGLTPSTTYHIRAYATNSTGTGYGTDITCTTNAEIIVPTVTTTAITGITSSGASSGGNVTSDGGATATKRGVCWSTSPNPVATGNSTDNGSGTGIYSSSITGLNANTLYYVRAYATNSAGTGYGSELQFTTLCNSPVVTANAASNISYTTATLNGTVNPDNVSTIPLFQYGTTTSYGTTINSTPYSVNGAANTAISADITGLTQGTLYHYRIVTSFCGADVYSNDQTFTTSTPGVPLLSTTTVTSIAGTTASSGGTITSDGGSAVTISGICWSTTNNPDVFDNKTTDGTTSGTFVSAMTGLTTNTLYYVRAYATNANGIGYGSEVSFTTLKLPSATTNAATSPTTTGATLNGTVNASGTSTDVTFEYGPTTSYGSSVAASPASVTGTSPAAVTAALSGLSENTTYHFRVKAVSLAGTVYGDDQTFTTLCVLPAAAVNAATGVGGTTATLNGVVNANGFSTTVTFEYGLTTSYGSTINATPYTATGTGNTVVSASVTGLLTNTTYYFRIKAVNCAGTVNSSELNFTTLQPPAATTSAATSVAYTTADLNGIVNANNSAATVTFDYGLTTSYGTTVAATPATATGSSPTAVSASLTGLSTGTTYHFRVKASSDGGTTNGVDMTFITAIPPSVTAISSTGITASAATLNCSVNPNNQSTNVYYEYGVTTGYGTTVNGTPLTVTGSSATAVSSTLSGLSAGTTYHYRVKTVSLGVTYYSGDNTFITCNPPAATSNAATSVTNTTATFNGTVNANGSSTTVTFDWGLDTGYGSSKTASPATVTGTSNTAVTGAMTGLSPNTTYHYRVKTVNCGGTVYGGDQYFTTLCTAPSATANAATNVTVSGVRMNGTVNANNFSTNVTFEYGLTTAYGSTGNASPYTVTGTSNTAVTLDVAGLTSNTIYHYRVKTVNCGGTVYSGDMSFTTLCPSSLSKTHTAGTVAPVTKTVTYWIIQSTLSGASKCWITSNLGASNEATSATDATEPSAGWYWRFNTTQGYKHDGSTRTPGGTWPGDIDENSDWLLANDPCALLLGSGWRIPTYTEWTNVDANTGWANYNDSYGSVFKIHAAGMIQASSGSLYNRGGIGNYYSSVQNATTKGYYLVTYSSYCMTSYMYTKGYAMTLRCVRD